MRDFGSDRLREHREESAREELAENARLLYVALTRARYLCTVTWGGVSGAGATALSLLLHGGVADGAVPDVARLVERFRAMDDGAIRADLDALAASSGGTIEVADAPVPAWNRYEPPREGGALPEARTFGGTVAGDHAVASFSSLTAGKYLAGEAWGGAKPWDEEGADRDGVVPAAAAPAAGSGRAGRGAPAGGSAFDFPRGTKAGTFFHDLMETVDFGADDRAVAAVVREKLSSHGFAPAWEGTVASLVRSVLSTPLSDSDPSFVLSSVGRKERLAEMAFSFPLGRLEPEAFLRAVDPLGEAVDPRFRSALSRLSFDAVRGMMKGAVDLLFRRGDRFYLLDWKTNHLGGRFEDYGRDALPEVVAEEFYFLQYWIYTVALDRYLAQRLGDAYDYDRCFGGAYYLFVRGMDPAKGPSSGVHFDRPSRALVSALSRLLSGGSA